jgi:flavorubredoxin
MIRELRKNIYAVGVQDWDRRLFDELIPLPHGTSYNAYLVIGSQKAALVDSADPAKYQDLLDNLAEHPVRQIDYLVCNHAEQDHSGSIGFLAEKFPQAIVVTNEKCKGFLMDLLHIPEDRFQAVRDGETISLGDKTLEFILAPWVHWPETMFTYLREDKVLFSCDFLGSHLATTDVFACDDTVLEGAKRYYAEIMMPFRSSIVKHLQKLETMDIELIAPSHGPVYKKPFYIVDAYKEWSSEQVKNEVVIPWVSMHGSTEAMVKHLTEALVKRGIAVKPFNLTKTDTGELASSLVDAATVVLATSTALVGPHPQGLYAAALVGALRPKTRFLGIIGSYGWGSKAVETIQSLITNVKAEVLPVVYIKGAPRKEDFESLDELAEAILEKHRSSGLL